jgi:surface antigen
MDADTIQQLATHLEAQAKSLNTILGSIDGLTVHIRQSWFGPDAQDFDGWWHNKHRPAFTAAIESVLGLVQSARNNVAEQDRASGTHNGTASIAHTPGAVTHPAPAHPATTQQPPPSLADYEASLHAGNKSLTTLTGEGQCTSWAVFRREQLGYGDPPWNGHNNGGEMAANIGLVPLSQAHVGSLVSYGGGDTLTSDGHVMVVEQIIDPRHLVVSEMNVNPQHNPPYGFRTDTDLVQQPDGTWVKTVHGAGGYTARVPAIQVSK